MNEDGILLENEILINYSNSSKNEIFNISNVFKIIYSQGINFHSSLKKTINTFFDESKVFEAKSLMGQNLNFFYQSILILLNNLNEMFQKFKLILIEPLEEYKVKLNNFNNSILSDYNLLVKKYYNSKEKVTKTQRQFYHSIIAYNKAKQEFNEKKKEYFNNDAFLKVLPFENWEDTIKKASKKLIICEVWKSPNKFTNIKYYQQINHTFIIIIYISN